MRHKKILIAASLLTSVLALYFARKSLKRLDDINFIGENLHDEY
jgi:hypothetical protein